MHLLKQKVHCYIYTIQGCIGIGPVDLAAARIKFHPQLKIVKQTRNFIAEQCMLLF